MLKKSSNKNVFPKTSDIANEKMICKDGFCSLPNQKENSNKHIKDINIFDPI